MTDRHAETYREEAAELLVELEGSLLELEDRPGDSELVGRVFRALHTIKGSGAMFGFDAIAAFTHEVETVFDSVREGRLAVTPALVGATLAARDHIQALLQVRESETSAVSSQGLQVLEALRQAAPGAFQPREEDLAAISEPANPQPPDLATYRIHFAPHPDILLTGTNPLLLLNELRGLGDFSVVAHVDRIPQLDSVDTEQCYTFWDAVLTTGAGENAIRDVFIFVEDRAEVSIARIDGADRLDPPRLGELLVDRGDVSSEDVEQCLSARPLTGEMLVRAGLVSPDRVRAAVLEQKHLTALREKKRTVEAVASLRVPAARLDSLVNVVGELVTVQARLSSYALASGESEVTFISEEVERLTELLRETSMSLRMLPVGETFNRFRRLVRDLSAELSKQAELTTSGNDTELDKTVIEQLSDPLVHLIRNSIDHGIESPEQRAAMGKPAMGSIHLAASHTGAFVQIKVSDDGGGLDREAIRARAIERGFIRPDAVLTEQQTDALILTPGFSTASKISEVSGRGVGMDVVQRNLDAMRGTLSISSTPGKGTVVTLKIPLTLAIIDGLLVEAGGARFVVPLSNVCGCMELSRGGAEAARQSLVSVRGELVPYIPLRDRFGIPGELPPIEQVIIAETHDGQYGFVVDRVIGDHHTVIKKLGRLFRDIDEVSGATILGDGSVALILDVERLAAAAVREQSQQEVGARS
jgi:two-component system chemotaxis sensor kinase CheA